MKQHRQEELFEEFPKIFADKNKTPQESAMAAGITTGDGWFWLIHHLCRALQECTDKDGSPQVVAFQVKEKFGGLKFYINNGSGSNEQYSLIHFTESLSYSVCEECGSMADISLRKGGWIRALCDTCNERHKQ